MILSASRRTDIPAYYSEWFLNRLREGYVLTRNPMNPSQISRITLSPEVVECIVFWTKDPLPMMNKLSTIEEMGYPYYFQFTLTPYAKDLESNLRDKKELIKTFLQLSETIGKKKVLWRYDPVILNRELTISDHREKFLYLCNQLRGYTDSCTISFIDLYAKLKKVSEQKLIRGITEEEMHQLAADFAKIAKNHGITLKTCSETVDLTAYGILPASCIDQKTIEDICGHPIQAKRDSNQRHGCGCIQSIDIGVYNTCKNGCSYCYANYSTSSVEKNYRSHNPSSEILIGEVRPGEKIIQR